MSRVTIGDLIDVVIPFEAKSDKIIPIEIVPRKIVEEIINKCEEDKQSCCDVAGTKEAEEDAIIFGYASEVIDFAKALLKEFEEENNDSNNQ